MEKTIEYVNNTYNNCKGLPTLLPWYKIKCLKNKFTMDDVVQYSSVKENDKSMFIEALESHTNGHKLIKSFEGTEFFEFVGKFDNKNKELFKSNNLKTYVDKLEKFYKIMDAKKSFKLSELFNYIGCSDENNKKVLLNLLCKKIKKEDLLEWECNYGSEKWSPESYNEYKQKCVNDDVNKCHSSEFMKLNCLMINKTPKEKNNKKEKDNENKETNNSTNDSNSILAEALKDENKDSENFNEECLYTVQLPCLSTKLYNEILKMKNVCPVKLLQFLQIYHGVSEEFYYNQLYHLSNCKCDDKTGWKYVVGDGIIVGGIELFDLMAYNMKEKKVVFYHVKKSYSVEDAKVISAQVFSCSELMYEYVYNKKVLDIFKRFDHAIELKLTEVLQSLEQNNKSENQKRDKVLSLERTKQEFQQFLSEIESLNQKDAEMRYYICLSPFLRPNQGFEAILNYPPDLHANGIVSKHPVGKILDPDWKNEITKEEWQKYRREVTKKCFKGKTSFANSNVENDSITNKLLFHTLYESFSNKNNEHFRFALREILPMEWFRGFDCSERIEEDRHNNVLLDRPRGFNCPCVLI